MSKKSIGIILLACSMAFLAGCATTGLNMETTMSVPANSQLAKVKTGMSTSEVTSILGDPSDIKQITTWKSYMPLYGMFASGDSIEVYYYKGLGKVQLESKGGLTGSFYVQFVKYDNMESGYNSISMN